MRNSNVTKNDKTENKYLMLLQWMLWILRYDCLSICTMPTLLFVEFAYTIYLTT